MPVRFRIRAILAAGLVLSCWGQVSAQELPLTAHFALPDVSYSESIPTPEQIMGHRIGSTHTRPHQIVDYFKAVAEASDRVIFGEYGRTFENRPLVYAVVTSRRNHSRLESIRNNNLRLSDRPESVSDDDLEKMPLVINMHYSVHGNEASGSEAAILLLYHLAAGSGSRIDDVLDNTIVIIDPAINPDGRDRFVDWVNGNRGRAATADPDDREHREPWPGGRTNHYWFDLNRDWLPVQQPESQARLDLFHAWRPQVLLDVHEMGSDATFFFQPGVPSRGNPNTPQRTFELTDQLTRGSARMLDQIGSLYYTRETFDDFYYGKGSTFPDINGSIGILFEQASSRALIRETDDGLLDYGFTVKNQLAASIGLLENAASMRTTLLDNQRDFYTEALDDAEAAGFDAWLIGNEADPSRVEELVRVLLRHRIEVRPLKSEVTVDATLFEPANAFVIPVRQRQYRLLKAAMERTTTFADSVFYDVSTWTLPLAFGLESVEYQGNLDHVASEPIVELGERPGQVHNAPASYAYIMPWGRYLAPRALFELLDAGVSARVALQPFEAISGDERVYFDRGAIIVPLVSREDGGLRPDQDEEPESARIHGLVQELAIRDQLDFYAVEGGLTEAGIDLGSPRTTSLRKPSIGVFSGRPLSGYRVGEVWHLLSERMQIPMSMIDIHRVSDVDLSRYDVLVLVDGDFSKVDEALGDAVREWVEKGGRLVAMQRAGQWAASAGIVAAEFPEEQESDTVSWVRYGDRSAAKQAREISGAIMHVDLDPTHPIAFGMGTDVAVFKTRFSVLKPPTEPGTVVGVYRRSPLLSGYAPTDRIGAIATTAAITSQKVKEGRVVLVQDVPSFRAFWLGTDLLLLNSILLFPTY